MAAADLYFLWVVTSFIFGITGAILARKSGKSPVAGFILGAVLNAVILLWLFSRNRTVRGDASVR